MKKYLVTYPGNNREFTILADCVLSDTLTAWHIHFELGGKTIAVITEPCTVVEVYNNIVMPTPPEDRCGTIN